MLNLIHSECSFWEKQLALPSQRQLYNSTTSRQNNLPVSVVQLQIKLVCFKTPVIGQRQTQQTCIQYGSYVLTFNGDTESRAFAVEIKKFRTNIHCSIPPTVFLILPIADVAEFCRLLS